MDEKVLVALAGGVGVVIGSLISIFITLLNNRHSFQLQLKQWEREDKSKREEAEERKQASEREQKRQERERLREIYSQCIQWLSILSRYSFSGTSLDPNDGVSFRENLRQVEHYLSQVLMENSHAYSRELEELRKSHITFYELNPSAAEVIKQSGRLRDTIAKVAASDMRLTSKS